MVARARLGKPLALLLCAAALLVAGGAVSLELALYLAAVAGVLLVTVWLFGRDITLPPF